mmetsp:Transcript_19406/g.19695  ORF Transcript_19406/g.19695 Transcript_19406/m.19695 type:complete len:104 (+) Transcript_19406:248-559(+)
MRDVYPPVSLICNSIPRRVLDATYGITVPVPTTYQLRERGLSNVPEYIYTTAQDGAAGHVLHRTEFDGHGEWDARSQANDTSARQRLRRGTAVVLPRAAHTGR